MIKSLKQLSIVFIVRHNRLEPHAVQKGKFVAIMR